MPSFTWTPEFGAQKQKRPRVAKIQFGDGYEQRTSFGMNVDPEVWPLQFANRDEAEKLSIDGFLTERGGVEAFEWTPPGASDPKLFVCEDWVVTIHKANLYSISATFREVFEP